MVRSTWRIVERSRNVKHVIVEVVVVWSNRAEVVEIWNSLWRVFVVLVVVVIDFVSMALRSAVTEEGDVDRPSWSSLFLPGAISSAMHPTPMKKTGVDESE